MSIIMQGVLGCFIGSVILILMYAALYYYREVTFKKEMAEYNKAKDFAAMRLYRERLKIERKRDSSNPDKTLANMRNVFSELQNKGRYHNEIKTRPNEPEFGKGWFAFVVQRDFAEINRQIEQSHNDKAG